jgi:hypothetical protein
LYIQQVIWRYSRRRCGQRRFLNTTRRLRAAEAREKAEAGEKEGEESEDQEAERPDKDHDEELGVSGTSSRWR